MFSFTQLPHSLLCEGVSGHRAQVSQLQDPSGTRIADCEIVDQRQQQDDRGVMDGEEGKRERGEPETFFFAFTNENIFLRICPFLIARSAIFPLPADFSPFNCVTPRIARSDHEVTKDH